MLPSSLGGHFSRELSDALHFPAAMLLLRWLQLCLGRRISATYLAGLALLGLALLEWLQAKVGRAAQWQDFWHGCLGLLLMHFWADIHRLLRYLLLLSGILYGGREFFATQLHYWQLQQSLPRLTTAPWLATSYGWQAISGSPIERIINPDRQVQFIVQLQPQQWQGMQWLNPGLDLVLSEELCFSAMGSGFSELQIRIDDAASADYASRFHSSVRLYAQWQRFCIDLRNMTDRDKRLMNKEKIIAIYWFSQPRGAETSAWFALAHVTVR